MFVLQLCHTEVMFLQGTADLEREDEEEMEDSGEVLDDSSSSPSSTLKNYPLTCKVLYSYKVPAEHKLLPPVCISGVL